MLALVAACSGGKQTAKQVFYDFSNGAGGMSGAVVTGSGGNAAPFGSGGSASSPMVTGTGGMSTPGMMMSAGSGGQSGNTGADAGAMTNMDASTTTSDGMIEVLLVGNSVSGSVSFIDAHSFANLGSVSVTPDMDEIMGEINADITRSVAYPAIKSGQLIHHFEPSNGDRFVDDVFVSPDGNVLYVSRSNLGDAAAFDLTKADHPRLWHTFIDGVKADHATISHDGSKLIVSATTANVADVIDAKTGMIMGTFATGDFPHQNDYSADGKHIYNSSIGNVGLGYAQNATKGNRWLVQVDGESLQVLKTWPFDYGIRPNLVTADEKTLYTQLSYLNGVVKYDLDASKEVARSEQPLSAFAMQTYANYDEYPHDSAHHGLALSGDGKHLCDCGTIDNTVSIVATDTMQVEKTIDTGMIPYWATTGPDGAICFVSLSGDAQIAVIDYAKASELKRVTVGTFPQRSRLGKISAAVAALLAPDPG
jgi:DNA-binding beta-propeller fold protein YncE